LFFLVVGMVFAAKLGYEWKKNHLFGNTYIEVLN
jgi:hypothetical protein